MLCVVFVRHGYNKYKELALLTFRFFLLANGVPATVCSYKKTEDLMRHRQKWFLGTLELDGCITGNVNLASERYAGNSCHRSVTRNASRAIRILFQLNSS
jgi:hypothetical protein